MMMSARVVFVLVLVTAVGCGDSGGNSGLRAWAVDGSSIVRSDDGGATWSSPLFSNLEVVLQAIRFADRDTGWAVGGSDDRFNAALLHTVDGGATWSDQLTNLAGIPHTPDAESFGFFGAAFTTSQHGVVVGAAGEGQTLAAPQPLIVVTDDAGARWQPVATSSAHGGFLRSVCLVPSGEGIAVGDVVLVTPDAGRTWTDISTVTGSGASFGAAACVPPDQFWISGTTSEGNAHNVILYSADGGTTWSDRTPTINNVRDAPLNGLPLAFVGATGWAIPNFSGPPSSLLPSGRSGFALHTTDAGVQWSEQPLADTFSGGVFAVAFFDAEHGVAVGSQPVAPAGGSIGAALVTQDGGATWRLGSFPSGIVAPLGDVAVAP